MCGIGAIFGKSETLKEDLKKSLSKIEHRGNELHESVVLDNCALGANRLAIVDRLSGKQPLTNEDKTIYAIQNGEIFNYKELKKDLKSKGHSFKTECDTEVLTHLWEEYGKEMINKIDSEMFAIVIYDKNKDLFFIARDPIGIKPLYYAYDSKKRLFIASEIKQLSQFDNIKEVREFPPGNYFFKGKFTKYFKIPDKANKISKEKIKKDLKSIIEKAVKKRVQTDLPIGVFLSGGVDSSFVMELATRYHKDVTAIILGTKSSPDLINAVKLCKEKNWKYKVVEPDNKYEEEEIKEIVYYAESYEPNIVRHSFANDMVSKKAAELGLKIILVGEGSDELFGGYNEFAELPKEKINLGRKMLLESMSNGNLMRVDKMAMKNTIEIRCPLFDTALIKYAMKISGKFKVVHKENEVVTKAIFREVASDYLPKDIAYRYKAPFANGAGMNIGVNFLLSDGAIGEIANKKISDKIFKEIKKSFPKYKFSTKEEIYYFLFYRNFNYIKFKDGEKRLIVKDNLTTI